MIKVKNWDKYQHYKDRNPPWIKLATDTFQNYEFSKLSDASKLLAICIWTLAARTKDGEVPSDIDWIKSQCSLSDIVGIKNLKELIEKGFLSDASNMLADCKQSARPEGEGEGEGETEKEEDYTRDFEIFWSEYPKRSGSNPKKPSFQKYVKARKNGATAELILSGVKAYAAHCKMSKDYGTKFVAQAQTWIYQERWNDEYTLVKKESQIEKLRRQTIGYVDPSQAGT